MAVTAGVLLERERELRALDAVLDAAREARGGAAVIEGPAGIGKTALLRATVDAGIRGGSRVLLARAAELESLFPFGVVRQLVESPVMAATPGARSALLAGAARQAAAVLDLDRDAGLDASGRSDLDPYAAVHGLFWLIANLAAEQPVLVAVDDLQWVDGPSLRFLAYLARRLEGLPVAVVATLRSGEATGDPAIAALLGEPALHHLRPGPLGTDAAGRLLDDVLGEAPDPEFAEACRSRTAGNPFLLAELTAELHDRGVRPTREAAGALEEVLPARVAAGTRVRLAALGKDAEALARALVVLGDGTEPGLAGALAELSAVRTAEAVARLGEADVLEPGVTLRFRHPLLRAAVAARIGAAELGRAHARAARLLAERGAVADQVRGHLLASPPGDGDPWVVEQLRDDARTARRRGAPELGAARLRRALAEPADPAVRLELLRELGRAELAAMEDDAVEHLREAHALAGDDGERADLALELGIALYSAGRHLEAVETLDGAIDSLGPEHRERRLRLEAFLAVAGRYDLDTEPAVRGRVHRVAAGLRGDTPGERLVLAVAAVEAPGPTAAGLVRAARLQERVVDEVPWPDPSEGVGTVAMYVHAGRPDLGRALADELLERARRSGSPVRHALALFSRGSVLADVGALPDAEADLRAALAAGVVLGAGTAAGVGLLVAVLAERGAPADAEALLAEHGLEGAVPEKMILNPLLHARAVLRLAQRRWPAAAADALELGRRHERWGIRRPSPNWRALAAEALRAQGDLIQAAALADASLALARSWDTPKAIAVALRARGLTREGDEQIRDLADALAALEETPWHLERARTGVDLGAALRRAGRRREAREHLGPAMDAAHRCGAGGLAEQAAHELRATGARPRRHAITGRDAITASERRVAALAADGLSNREIAQELFVTLPTVETHLSRAYRKLGVEGRAGLPAALAGQ